MPWWAWVRSFCVWVTRQRALAYFREVQEMGFDEDVELMLTMGRALYREGLYPQATGYLLQSGFRPSRLC